MTELHTVEAALLSFNAARASYGLPPVDAIPSPRPDLTVVSS